MVVVLVIVTVFSMDSIVVNRAVTVISDVTPLVAASCNILKLRPMKKPMSSMKTVSKATIAPRIFRRIKIIC